jgi:hypothetical protein
MDAGKAGYIAGFKTADTLLAAARRMRESGYRRMDAFSPFPIEGLAEILGARDDFIPHCMAAGGLLGGMAAYAMQYFAAVIDYPIVSGGKPLNSWPAFIPVSFELTVFGATLCGFLAMLFLNGLPRLHHPLFAVPGFDCASRDRFFLYIGPEDPGFEPEQVRTALQALEPESLHEVPGED